MPAKKGCCVRACTSILGQERITFHHFPKPGNLKVADPVPDGDETLTNVRIAWIKRLGMNPRGSSMVCSRHFTSEDYVTKAFNGTNCWVLKETAVPSLNINTPESILSFSDSDIPKPPKIVLPVVKASKRKTSFSSSEPLKEKTERQNEELEDDTIERENPEIKSEKFAKKIKRDESHNPIPEELAIDVESPISKCSVDDCTSLQGEERISFHSFPRSGLLSIPYKHPNGIETLTDLRDAWIMRLGKTPVGSSVVCSKHFSSEDYVAKVFSGANCWVLKESAIPSLNIEKKRNTCLSPVVRLERSADLSMLGLKKDTTPKKDKPADKRSKRHRRKKGRMPVSKRPGFQAKPSYLKYVAALRMSQNSSTTSETPVDANEKIVQENPSQKLQPSSSLLQLKKKIMSLKCVVPGCKSEHSSVTENHIKFYKFPKPGTMMTNGRKKKKMSDLRELWLKKIRKYTLPRRAFICSMHFLWDDFLPEEGEVMQQWQLKIGAVPSLYLPNPRIRATRLKKRKTPKAVNLVHNEESSTDVVAEDYVTHTYKDVVIKEEPPEDFLDGPEYANATTIKIESEEYLEDAKFEDSEGESKPRSSISLSIDFPKWMQYEIGKRTPKPIVMDDCWLTDDKTNATKPIPKNSPIRKYARSSCPKCGKHIKVYFQLQQHVRACRLKPNETFVATTYTCPVCEKVLHEEVSIMDHISSCNLPAVSKKKTAKDVSRTKENTHKQRSCPKCGRLFFTTMYHFVSHVFMCKDKPMPTYPFEAIYKCPLCRISIKGTDLVMEHIVRCGNLLRLKDVPADKLPASQPIIKENKKRKKTKLSPTKPHPFHFKSVLNHIERNSMFGKAEVMPKENSEPAESNPKENDPTEPLLKQNSEATESHPQENPVLTVQSIRTRALSKHLDEERSGKVKVNVMNGRVIYHCPKCAKAFSSTKSNFQKHAAACLKNLPGYFKLQFYDCPGCLLRIRGTNLLMEHILACEAPVIISNIDMEKKESKPTPQEIKKPAQASKKSKDHHMDRCRLCTIELKNFWQRLYAQKTGPTARVYIPCPHCHINYTKDMLIEHVTHHDAVENETLDDVQRFDIENLGSISCFYCPQEFGSENEWGKHQRLHKDMRRTLEEVIAQEHCYANVLTVESSAPVWFPLNDEEFANMIL